MQLPVGGAHGLAQRYVILLGILELVRIARGRNELVAQLYDELAQVGVGLDVELIESRCEVVYDVVITHVLPQLVPHLGERRSLRGRREG